MKFITSRICPFAQRVWLVLEQTKSEYEEVQVSIKPGEKSEFFTSAYAASRGSDPKSDGKVPILQDGDVSMTESLHVADYVAAKAAAEGRENILPTTPSERFFTGIFLEQGVSPLLGPFYGHLKAQTVEDQAATKENLDAAFANLDKQLGTNKGGPFALGARPSFADFMLYPFVERLVVLKHYRGYDVDARLGNFYGWKAAIEELQSVKNTRQSPSFFIEGYEKYAKGPL